MRTFLRCWDTLSKAERIVAMSLVAGSITAMVNSTVWAVAVCYMAHEKTLVRLADAEARAARAESATQQEVEGEHPR